MDSYCRNLGERANYRQGGITAVVTAAAIATPEPGTLVLAGVGLAAAPGLTPAAVGRPPDRPRGSSAGGR